MQQVLNRFQVVRIGFCVHHHLLHQLSKPVYAAGGFCREDLE